MRIVMTGCGGFIGSHLLDQLMTRSDVEIEGWDPSVEKIRKHLDNPNLNLHQRPVDDANTWNEFEAAVKDADVVINLAAICNPAEYNTRPLATIKANFFEASRAVEVCAKHKTWIIGFSTSETYGRTLASYMPNNTYDNPNLYELKEDETPLIMGPITNQRWSYATAKQLLERYTYAHHAEMGMPFTTIRPLNFFGPRMDYIPGRDGEGTPRVLACFMTALMDKKPMQLVDGGTARRTIVSIHDAIRCLLLMIDKPDKAQNQIFNIGNRNNEVDMAELADLMRNTYADITGDESYRQHPIESISSLDFYGPGYEDCDRRMPNIDKARNLLGWEPRIPLKDALLETMTYYHKHYAHIPAANRVA